MKRIFVLSLAIIALHGVCFAQASGNAAYSQSGGSNRARQNERGKRVLQPGDAPPSATSMFLEANVLMNVKADEYVAVFGVLQEGATVAECNQKMDAVVGGFSSELKQLGIRADDIYVDFAAQNKIYGFQLAGTIAKERLAGFELKKNVSVHYKDKLLLDRLVIAASNSRIFDLIKVDYVVRDTPAIQAKLMSDAAQVIKQKAAMYETLLGIRLQPPVQVFAERPSMYSPAEMYDSYTASESEEMSGDSDRQKYTIQGARKSRTFFFNALSADGFDCYRTSGAVHALSKSKVRNRTEEIARR